LCKADKSQVLGEGTISGVNLDRFSPQQAAIHADAVARDLNLPAGRQYVLFVGRIVAHKGIDTLIQAWNLIGEKTRQQTTLLIAGANAGDALFSRLDDLVQSDSSVRYLGRIDNVVGLYGLADLLVLPSWHEGFPYSVLEAQACGLPAIVSRVTGNVDSVIDGETGLHVEKNNAKELAAAIEQLLSDPDTLSRLGQHATERVVEHFQEQLVLSNLIEFYRSQMSG
jgi:glycosyltransferase involved in cell wall biosynthesis